MRQTDGIRLLVCDLDGTLVEPDGSVSGRTQAALAGVRGAGVRVAIATGRIPRGISRLVEELELRGPHITMHGALVVDLETGDQILSRTLDADGVEAAVAVGEALDLPTLLCYPDGFRTNRLGQDVIDLFVPFNEPVPEEVPDLQTLRETRPHKVAIWTGHDQYESALAVTRQRLGEEYAITSGDNRSIEILVRGVDKASATQALARWLDIDLDQVAAVGDGTNDIEMLRTVPHSVAMRHARPEVREAAGAALPDDRPDDLASAVELLLPELAAIPQPSTGGRS
jgi:Cof subfamily protein (haloacid dehalogenase superfamily)